MGGPGVEVAQSRTLLIQSKGIDPSRALATLEEILTGRPHDDVLADPRQAVYVQDGWNITGDTFVADTDGYFYFQARNDDMIVSSGYNIAGPEVEAALLSHPAVVECGVVAAPDEARGMIVKAYVIVAAGVVADGALATELQDHVKREIAPYKYPRAIEFVEQLPKTGTGKLQRFALRQIAQGGASSAGMAAE